MRGRPIDIRRPRYTATEELRVPCGSWWTTPNLPREGLTELVTRQHQQRMRARGVSAFSENPSWPPVGKRGIGI